MGLNNSFDYGWSYNTFSNAQIRDQGIDILRFKQEIRGLCTVLYFGSR